MNVLTISLLGLLSLTAGQGDDWQQLQYNFRSREFQRESLEAIGDEQSTQLDERGLVTDLATGTEQGNVGVEANERRIFGDFEVTASYGALQAPKPKSGYGTGAALQISDGGDTGSACSECARPMTSSC